MARKKVVKTASRETVLFNLAITKPAWHNKQPNLIQNSPTLAALHVQLQLVSIFVFNLSLFYC